MDKDYEQIQVDEVRIKALFLILLISKRKINIFNYLFILSDFLHRLTYFFEASQHKNRNTFPIKTFSLSKPKIGRNLKVSPILIIIAFENERSRIY